MQSPGIGEEVPLGAYLKSIRVCALGQPSASLPAFFDQSEMPGFVLSSQASGSIPNQKVKR